jgi:LemA protein
MIYIIVALLIIIGILVMVYNDLVSKKNEVANAYGSIDVMLKKRYDLLPNLVAVVKTYMENEKNILLEITELRTRRFSEGIKNDEKDEIDTKIGKTMGSIMISTENYPNLKANQNFLKLQSAWNEVEEQISAARRSYNAAVTDYNSAFEMFPGNLFASSMRYSPKKVFETPENERQNISAEELFKKHS